MSKVCGCYCEHNKSGICQITGCIKKAHVASSTFQKDKLIKYLEDKIKEIKDECASLGHLIDKSIWYEFDLKISGYQDILEKVRSGKYE